MAKKKKTRKQKIPNNKRGTSRRKRTYGSYLDDLLNLGILPDKRVLYIGDVDDEGINGALTQRYIMAISLLGYESKNPINVQLNSTGGNLQDAFAIYDALRLSKCPVYVLGIGNVASAGSIVLQSADKGNRYLSENSTLLLHQCSVNPEEIVSTNLTALANQTKKDNSRMVKILSRRAKNLKGAALENRMKSDFYIDPTDAVRKYGFADKVITKRSSEKELFF